MMDIANFYTPLSVYRYMIGVAKRWLVACITGGAVLFTIANANAASGNWDIERIKDDIIYFRNGVTFKTSLYDVRYIGRLKSDRKSQIIIFSGKDCKDCCAQNAVFFYSSSEKKVVEPEYAPYDFPGIEYSAQDSIVLYKSRMFYGKVLPNVANGIIWYQEMLDEDGQYRKSVYLVRLEKNKIKEEFLLENLPHIEDTLSLERSKDCEEMEGFDYLSSEL